MIKNVFNWSVGSFFRTIGRIIAYLLIGALIGLILSKNDISISNLFLPKLSAATLTSYDTYQKFWNQESGCGTSNRYSYTQYANNNPGNDLWDTGVFGTQYSGKAAMLGFSFQYNLTAGKYYDVDVNFNTSDLSSSLNTTNVFIDSGTSCQDFTGNRVSLIGFSLSNSGTNYSNKATLRILANSATTYWGFYFYKGVGQYVTGVNNWRVNSITINEVTDNSTNIVIDNATNNTTNIINNNNENTQQIIDNQNDLLGSKCNNMLNPSSTNTGILCNGNGNICNSSNSSITKRDTENGQVNVSTTNTWAGFYFSYIDVDPSTTYYMKYTTSISDNYAKVAFYDSSNTYISELNFSQNYNFNFTTPSNAKYIRISISNRNNGVNFNITKMSLFNSSSSFCAYGSFTSKLDDTTNAINDVNDSINNDNVSGATSSASNFFSNFTTNTHGLTSIITAPLSAIQSLTNASCSPLVLPLPFVNQNLTLPCMRQIYVDNFGSFMTLYDTITFGIISYWVLVRIFALVKDFKNPEHDEIEVMDL